MRYFIIIVLGSSFNALSQTWCTPGATWRFEILHILGYVEYYYSGDTLLDGYEAQVIHGLSVLQYPQPPPQPPSAPHYTDTTLALITRNDGDLVYLWSPSTETWDTLFWWSAQIGDQWLMAHGGDWCEPFEVLDIGTMEVDGVELRWLDLNNASGRIVERFGSLGEFLPFCPPGHIDGLAGLRCYTDDEINYRRSGWIWGCTSLVGVQDPERSIEPPLFPNPGTDHFTLQLPSGPHQLALFDAHGRQVLRQHLTQERPVISTASLPSGIYHIHIADRYGRISGQRWVKE